MRTPLRRANRRSPNALARAIWVSIVRTLALLTSSGEPTTKLQPFLRVRNRPVRRAYDPTYARSWHLPTTYRTSGASLQFAHNADYIRHDPSKRSHATERIMIGLAHRCLVSLETTAAT